MHRLFKKEIGWLTRRRIDHPKLIDDLDQLLRENRGDMQHEIRVYECKWLDNVKVIKKKQLTMYPML